MVSFSFFFFLCPIYFISYYFLQSFTGRSVQVDEMRTKIQWFILGFQDLSDHIR